MMVEAKALVLPNRNTKDTLSFSLARTSQTVPMRERVSVWRMKMNILAKKTVVQMEKEMSHEELGKRYDKAMDTMRKMVNIVLTMPSPLWKKGEFERANWDITKVERGVATNSDRLCCPIGATRLGWEHSLYIGNKTICVVDINNKRHYMVRKQDIPNYNNFLEAIAIIQEL